MDKQHENHNQGISIAVQSLNVLAQCAVGVFSVIGTITVALASIGIERKKLVYLVIAFVFDTMSIFFHRQFKKWASPYIVQIMLCDDRENYYITYGLKVLSCYLFDVANWKNLKKVIKKQIYGINGRRLVLNKDTIKKLNQRRKSIRLEKKAGHIGVLTALWISEILIIVFIAICKFKLNWRWL